MTALAARPPPDGTGPPLKRREGLDLGPMGLDLGSVIFLLFLNFNLWCRLS
jgi:hypothetical protein